MRKTRIRSIYRISGGPDAPAKARHIAARELEGTEAPELVDNASLLLSEIMADRLSRSHSSRGLTIDVRQTGSYNWWCVIDRGRPTLPGGLRSTALDELADAWGVSRRSGLTRTWFELAYDATVASGDSDNPPA